MGTWATRYHDGSTGAPGPLRHPAPGRPPARHVPVEVDAGGRPPVHRGGADVLPGHRRPRGPPAVLVQGRRTRLRAGPRADGAVLPELRRQRDVPVARQRPREPARPDAVHRLRAAEPDPRVGPGHHHATIRASSAAIPGAQFAVHVAVDDVFPNCPRYIHRMRPPRAVGERARRRRVRRRSPSGSACRCSTRCSPPTTRPVPDLSRRAFLALGATVVVGACSRTTTTAHRRTDGRARRTASTTADAGRRRRPPTTTTPTTTTTSTTGAADDDRPPLPADPFALGVTRRRPGRHVGRCCGPGWSATGCPTRSTSRGRRRRDDFATVASSGHGHGDAPPTATACTPSSTSPGRSPTASRPAASPARSGGPAPAVVGATRPEARRRHVPALRDRLLRRPPRPRRVGARRRRLPRRLHLRGCGPPGRRRGACASHDGPEPTDLAGYRGRYAQYLADPTSRRPGRRARGA